MTPAIRWAPTALLFGGCVLLLGVGRQLTPELRAPLSSALPTEVRGMRGQDPEITEQEALVAGFTDYAARVYEEPPEPGSDASRAGWASVYIGFYESQTRGRTIHSPKNCLPGAGWQVLSSVTEDLPRVDGNPTVNRYVLQNGEDRALVLYWYQGRGRVAHNEYLVKWDLMRDAALRRRTDEALVRIVVPITTSEDDSFSLAQEIAGQLKPALDRALPL